MNAHYVAWNCEEMDKNGENLYEEFGEKGLICDKPRHIVKNG